MGPDLRPCPRGARLVTELEILRGRLLAAEAGIEILTRERDEARDETARVADALSGALGRERAALASREAARVAADAWRQGCLSERARVRRLCRRLARVLRLSDAWAIPTGHPRGRVWSRRLAP